MEGTRIRSIANAFLDGEEANNMHLLMMAWRCYLQRPACNFQGALCLNIGSTLRGISMNSRATRKYMGKGRSIGKV